MKQVQREQCVNCANWPGRRELGAPADWCKVTEKFVEWCGFCPDWVKSRKVVKDKAA